MTPHNAAKCAPSLFPRVQGTCPRCGSKDLFLGFGGYVTCAWIECREPDAATKVLEFDPKRATDG